MSATTLEIVSRISGEGRLRLSLAQSLIREPALDELLIEVRAAPLNPSDIILLLGPVDMRSLSEQGTRERPIIEGQVSPAALGPLAARLDKPLSVGNEGAGIVIKAGMGVAHLLGRTVAFRSREGAYATHRVVNIADCIVTEEGVASEAAASAFINPLTALCMLETLRREGHRALVHTAAASNLGQMLNRLCFVENIPLVNIVRSAEQVALLRAQGSAHVIDSSAAGFQASLEDAVRATGATLAFDAIGGGDMASDILAAMETVERGKLGEYSRYGAPTHRQVYIYGVLDPSPRIIRSNVGTAWGVGGWLMSWVLEKLGPEVAARLKARVAAELETTFASHYAGAFDLAEVLTLDAIGRYTRRATNQKYLVLPNGQSA